MALVCCNKYLQSFYKYNILLHAALVSILLRPEATCGVDNSSSLWKLWLLARKELLLHACKATTILKRDFTREILGQEV